MTNKELALKYPVLYHVAEAGSWPSIQKHGLLSTTALLKLFECSGDRRAEIESSWRPGPVTISHPRHGTAVIRDQIPMPEAQLQECLVAMTPRQWYELINRKVFFWAREWDLHSFLRAYRDRSHCVITLSTDALLNSQRERITLCRINSGSVRGMESRGRDTFKLIGDYSLSPSSVREVAVEYSVPEIWKLEPRVVEMQRNRELRVIWERRITDG